MSRYEVKVRVVQQTVKDVEITVDAREEEEVYYKIMEAMKTYPREIQVEGIHKMQPVRIEYEAPSDVHLITLREDKRYSEY